MTTFCKGNIIGQQKLKDILHTLNNKLVFGEEKTPMIYLIKNKANLGQSFILKSHAIEKHMNYHVIDCAKIRNIASFRKQISYIKKGSLVVLKKYDQLNRVIMKWFSKFLVTNHRDMLMLDIINTCYFFLLTKKDPSVLPNTIEHIELENYTKEEIWKISKDFLSSCSLKTLENKRVMKRIATLVIRKQNIEILKGIHCVIENNDCKEGDLQIYLDFYLDNPFLLCLKLSLTSIYVLLLIFHHNTPDVNYLRKVTKFKKSVISNIILELVASGYITKNNEIITIKSNKLSLVSKINRKIGLLPIESILLTH